MEQKSIKTQLMERLGINSKEASALIKTYARNHEGKISVRQIVDDIEKLAYEMIYSVGYLYKNYDVRHEILECGKDREEEAIMSLLYNKEDDSLQNLAHQYLINRYANNVAIWSGTFFHTAQKELLEILDEGIDSYREFVDGLPYRNINRVASSFDIESETVKFLALNGTSQDFQEFMTDIGIVKHSEMIEGQEGKEFPQDLSDKLFTKLQESIQSNNFSRFSRKDILRGLSIINKDKVMTKEEKQQLQDLFIEHSLKGEIDYNFIRLVRSKVPEKFNTIKEYLQMSSNTSWEEKDKYLQDKILPVMQEDMKTAYQALLVDMQKEERENGLTPEKVNKLIYDSYISENIGVGIYGNGQNSLYLKEDEKTKEIKLCIITANPITLNEIKIELDGTKLKEIIDRVNEKSINSAKEKLAEYTEKGIGEISICDNLRVNPYVRMDSSIDEESVLGVLTKEQDSPYVVVGRNKNGIMTDLSVEVPYSTIENSLYVRHNIAQMSPEQIQQFNYKAEPVEVKEHSYTYGKVDGYYRTYVSDFEINDEQYHIENDDWSTQGGRYTVVWKGEEEKYPETAMGISSSHSEWADCQNGVDIEFMIKLINEMPERFSKYYNSNARKCDCCGRFPAPHIERIIYEMMEMPTESELHKAKLNEQVSQGDEFVASIVNSAERRAALREQNEKAQELLQEYEKLMPTQEQSKNDE